MAINKINLMHRLYGKCAVNKCRDCMHIKRYLYRGKRYIKCEVYGETHSEASDWRLEYDACGLYNKDTKAVNVIRVVSLDRKPDDMNEPLPGQINLFEVDNGNI